MSSRVEIKDMDHEDRVISLGLMSQVMGRILAACATEDLSLVDNLPNNVRRDVLEYVNEKDPQKLLGIVLEAVRLLSRQAAYVLVANVPGLTKAQRDAEDDAVTATFSKHIEREGMMH